MKAGTWSKPDKTAKPDTLTLRQAAALYADSDAWAALGERTRQTEPSKQKRPLEVLGDRDVRSITSEDVRQYIKQRLLEAPQHRDKGKTMSQHGVRLEVAALSGILRFCVEGLKVIDANPVRGVRRPKGKGRNRRLTDGEIGLLFDVWNMAGSGKEYIFFRILFALLCRPGELCWRRCKSASIRWRGGGFASWVPSAKERKRAVARVGVEGR